MAMKIQKVKLLLGVFGLLISVGLAGVWSPAASAASKGTCYIEPNSGGTAAGYSQKCSDVFPNGKDSAGHTISATKCYDVSGGLANQVAKAISCSSNLFDKTPAESQCENQGGTYANGACKLPINCASASGTTNCDPAVNGGNCSNVQHCDLITKYVNPLINFLAALVGVAVVISIVIGGIQYGSSAGDPAKVTAAKNRIRNAIIALVTFLLLYALLNFLIPGGLF